MAAFLVMMILETLALVHIVSYIRSSLGLYLSLAYS